MVRFGVLLCVLGFGSAVLHFTEFQFRLLMWSEPMQPGLGLGIGALGVVFVVIAPVRNRATAPAQSAAPAYGPPPGTPPANAYGPATPPPGGFGGPGAAGFGGPAAGGYGPPADAPGGPARPQAGGFG